MSTTVNSAAASTGGTSAGTAAGAAVAAAAKNAAGTSLNSSQFLQLMTTQLKNQNPTQPLDPSQFVSQLAQLSEVSSIEGMQTSIASLVSSLSASQLLTGSTLVGRDVTAPGDTVNLGATGAPSSGVVTVPAGTTALQVNVVDATGQTITSLGLAPQAGTQQPFSWDGTAAGGTRAPAGTYTFQAVGVVGGHSTSLTTAISTPVQSVSVDSATNTLMLNTGDLGSIPFTSVTQVN